MDFISSFILLLSICIASRNQVIEPYWKSCIIQKMHHSIGSILWAIAEIPSQSSVVGVFKKWYHSCIQKVLFTKNQLQKMFSMIEMYPDDKFSWWNSVISINWWDDHSYVSSTVIPKIVSSESFNLCVNTAPVILLHSMVCNKYQV